MTQLKRKASASGDPKKPIRERARKIIDAPASKHRMRILLFACSPVDARTTLNHADSTEVAFLPSFDLEEIRNEILRFKPRLITCRADFFLRLLSAVPSRTVAHEPLEGSVAQNRVQPALVSPRETKVLAMLVQGKTNNQMARELRMSSRTVKRTLSGLFERFGATNRTDLTHRTARLCLLENGS